MTRLAVLCLTLCVEIAGQNTFVVPALHAVRPGNSFVLPLVPTAAQQPARVQCVWDRSEVPIPAGVLLGMDLRRTQWAGYRDGRNASATWDIQLTMATSPLGASGAVPTFAANVNPDATVVFQGFVSLPGGTEFLVPAPFTVAIPFQVPFPYAPGTQARGLTADFVVRSYQPLAGGIWFFDGQTTVGGWSMCCSFNPLCRLGNGNASNEFRQLSALAPGQQVAIEYQGLVPNAPGAVALGTMGPGGTWGGVQLPIDLTAAGAPGCRWFVSAMLWLPAVCSPTGNLRFPNVRVPSDPLLTNTGPYHHQGLVLDPAANSLGLVPTLAGSFYLGAHAHPPGKTISWMNDTGGSPTGTVQQQALVAQFRH